jgi:hypothetical protein
MRLRAELHADKSTPIVMVTIGEQIHSINRRQTTKQINHEANSHLEDL